MDKGYIQCCLERGSSSVLSITVSHSLHYLMPCYGGWARFTPGEIQMKMDGYAIHRGRPLPDFLTKNEEEKAQRELLKALDIHQRIFNAMEKYPVFWLNYIKTY